MSDYAKIRESSIPLPDGGDTHFDIFGNGPNDFTVTTAIPIGDGIGTVKIHDNPFDSGNLDTNNFNIQK